MAESTIPFRCRDCDATVRYLGARCVQHERFPVGLTGQSITFATFTVSPVVRRFADRTAPPKAFR